MTKSFITDKKLKTEIILIRAEVKGKLKARKEQTNRLTQLGPTSRKLIILSDIVRGLKISLN